MITFVLDASVAAKWMLPAKGELLRPQAFGLLDAYGAGEIEFLVPDIFWAECGSIVWKAVRQQRIDRADAELAIDTMIARKFPTVSSEILLADAAGLAFDFDRSVYDCLYVALAVQTNRQLVTADERLANALAARLPVKWLGAL